MKERKMRTGMGVKTRGQTQHRNGNGSGDANESSSGDGNRDDNGNGDGNEDAVGEGEGEAKKRMKPHGNCRRDQALSFCTRHYLCRQGVALASTRQLRSQGSAPVQAHCTEGVTRFEGREGANRVGGGIEIRSGI